MVTCRTSDCFLGRYLSNLSVPMLGVAAAVALLYDGSFCELSIFNESLTAPICLSL